MMEMAYLLGRVTKKIRVFLCQAQPPSEGWTEKVRGAPRNGRASNRLVPSFLRLAFAARTNPAPCRASRRRREPKCVGPPFAFAQLLRLVHSVRSTFKTPSYPKGGGKKFR